jgi:hypothetical protein
MVSTLEWVKSNWQLLYHRLTSKEWRWRIRQEISSDRSRRWQIRFLLYGRDKSPFLIPHKTQIAPLMGHNLVLCYWLHNWLLSARVLSPLNLSQILHVFTSSYTSFTLHNKYSTSSVIFHRFLPPRRPECPIYYHSVQFQLDYEFHYWHFTASFCLIIYTHDLTIEIPSYF